MTEFEYLSVLVSIIVGLGLSHLLSSAARLMQMRRRTRMYAPTLLWMGMLFLAHVQIWWAAFERRNADGWNFFSFVLFLLVPVCAYLLAYVLVPDLEGEDEVDLRASFHENRPWFFVLLAALPVVSLLQEYAWDGGVRPDADAGFRVAFAVMAAAAARVRSDAFHLANVLIVLLLFCAYVFTLFLQLA